MFEPKTFAGKSPVPVYALAFPTSDTLIYAGGGGKSKSGVSNVIRSVCIEHDTSSLKESAETKLSTEEDAPMCMALSVSAQGLEGVEAAETETAEPTEKKVLVCVNEADTSGTNKNLRLYRWYCPSHSAKGGEKQDSPSLSRIHTAPSIRMTDPEVYIRKAVVSPDGNLLALGSTDGQIALHAFPSLDKLWSKTTPEEKDVLDVTFSSDSALVAFVSPNSINIFATTVDKSPDIYQTIRNPSLKGASGCVFRGARFGRYIGGKEASGASNRLFTVVNANPPSGLGSSRKDRDKAKIRKCFVSSWNTDTWTLLSTTQIADRPATVVEMSPNGKHLALGTSDLCLHVLSTVSLKTIWKVRDAHAFASTCLAFNPKGDILASGSADMSVRIIQIGRQQEPAVAQTLLAGKFSLAALAFVLALFAWYLQQFLVQHRSL